MNNDMREAFKKAKKFKTYGFAVMIVGFIIAFIVSGLLDLSSSATTMVLIIVAAIALIVMRGFSCPSCGHVFDSRLKSYELIHCPKCGVQLQED